MRFITRDSGRRTWSSISGASAMRSHWERSPAETCPDGGGRRWRRTRRQTVATRACGVRRSVAGQHRTDVVRRALLLWRRGFSPVFGALGQLAQLVLRQPFNLLADLGERQVLVLQLPNQAKPVAVNLAVFRAPPGAIGGREEALLDVEIDRAGGDAGVVAEGLEVKLSHAINITVPTCYCQYIRAPTTGFFVLCRAQSATAASGAFAETVVSSGAPLCLACAFGLLAAVSPRPDRFDPRGPELTGDSSLAGRVVCETIGPLRFPTGRTSRPLPPAISALVQLPAPCAADRPRSRCGQSASTRLANVRSLPSSTPGRSRFRSASSSASTRNCASRAIRQESVPPSTRRTHQGRDRGWRTPQDQSRGSLGFLNRLDVRKASRRRPNVVEPQEYLLQLSLALISSSTS